MADVVELYAEGQGPDTLLSVIRDAASAAQSGKLRSVMLVAIGQDGSASMQCFLDVEAGDRLTAIAAIERAKFRLLAVMNGVPLPEG